MAKKREREVTVSQLAKILGITRQAVRKAIVEGRIKNARKLGHQWVILYRGS